MNKKSIISEGGAGGSMRHPFALPSVKTGGDLIDFFETASKHISKKRDKVNADDSVSIKFDGVNTSIKLIDGPTGKEFALDRGSLSDLDVSGVSVDKLGDRFSAGHGMIGAGKIILGIFNSAIPKIKPELEALGLWDDSTKYFNCEFVWEKTNVIQYPENFIAIHGVNQFYEKTHSRTGDHRPGLVRPVDSETGKPIKDKAVEAVYDGAALERLKEKISPIAQKYGFNIYTVVPAIPREGIKRIDYSPALNKEVIRKFVK